MRDPAPAGGLPRSCRLVAHAHRSVREPTLRRVRWFTNVRAAQAEKREREDADMRYVLLALGIAACIALHQTWLSHVAGTALSDDAHLAIELRCKGRQGGAARDCHVLLEKLYLAGTLDPEKTLRTYCAPSRLVQWGARRPARPALCDRRDGGGRSS